jgi:Na+-transporting NADH:ubiquinone oxidoreductase subunit NqrB
MAIANPPVLHLGTRAIPVVLPRVADSRMQLAAVTMSLHVLGQLGLGFRVSVPQIFTAIVTAALIDLVIEYRRSGRLVWPASAMLTGSGVALILRVVGTERGDHWTWQGWHWFAIVSAASLATKYVITWRGSHVFNPSNLGLVAAFLILGSGVVEPLDFWWSPLDGWMTLAYLVIVGGGLLITSRLGLVGMGAVFWATFAAGLGVLSASGHCMTATWAAQPVCGPDFWWRVVTSPEVAIFLFFMITDPKTAPVGKVSRLVFSVAVAVASVLLIAPQSTEFGAKVGLLAGLTLLSPTRYLLDRLVGPDTTGLAYRITTRGGTPAPSRVLVLRGAVVGSIAVLAVSAVVIAGTPARTAPVVAAAGAIDVDIDPALIPGVTVADDVSDIVPDVGDGSALALVLAENLAVEARAMATGDVTMLLSVDIGERLSEIEALIDTAASDGIRVATHHQLGSLHLRLMPNDGSQAGAALAFDATGTTETITYDATGIETARTSRPLDATFVLRQGPDRWMNAHSIPSVP